MIHEQLSLLQHKGGMFLETNYSPHEPVSRLWRRTDVPCHLYNILAILYATQTVCTLLHRERKPSTCLKSVTHALVHHTNGTLEGTVRDVRTESNQSLSSLLDNCATLGNSKCCLVLKHANFVFVYVNGMKMGICGR